MGTELSDLEVLSLVQGLIDNRETKEAEKLIQMNPKYRAFLLGHYKMLLDSEGDGVKAIRKLDSGHEERVRKYYDFVEKIKMNPST